VSGVTVLTDPKACPACNGTCRTMHPGWEEFWRVHATDETGRDVHEHAREWFGVGGVAPLPPEEIVCETCNGRGRVGTERPLDDVVKNVYDLLHLHERRISALEERLKITNQP